MALSPELELEIETMITGVPKNKIRRIGISINKFLATYSTLLMQVDKDSAALTGSGLQPNRIPLFKGLFEMLSITIGDRRGLTPQGQESKLQIDNLMALAEIDRKRLMVVGNYIAQCCSNTVIERNMREIAKGSGTIDTLCDNLSLVALISKYPDITAQIRPGQFEITSAYLDEVKKRALELLSSLGIVIEKGVPQNKLVDRQNRIISLCLDAIAEIKCFANAAYLDNSDYYDENYVTSTRKTGSDEQEPLTTGTDTTQ
jgi:hypothetical protein